ncbi:MAG: peptidoglycan-binding domain-containing protein [Patescibacteria group bacterium]
MNKTILLMVVLLVFAFGCGQRTQKAEPPTEPELALNETEPMELTESSQTSSEPTQNLGVGTQTQTAVPPEAALPEKPTTEDIQKALKNVGLYQGNIDGTIGPKTKKAIEEFQSKNNLKVDGKVGPKTWKLLKTYLNKTQESSTQEISN